jgi:hypothetical protein
VRGKALSRIINREWRAYRHFRACFRCLSGALFLFTRQLPLPHISPGRSALQKGGDWGKSRTHTHAHAAGDTFGMEKRGLGARICRSSVKFLIFEHYLCSQGKAALESFWARFNSPRRVTSECCRPLGVSPSAPPRSTPPHRTAPHRSWIYPAPSTPSTPSPPFATRPTLLFQPRGEIAGIFSESSETRGQTPGRIFSREFS